MESAFSYPIPVYERSSSHFVRSNLASVSPTVATIPPKENQPARKQNHSCDQCRKGKRKCDANVSKGSNKNQNQNGTTYPGPCGYCRKTKKNCTFEWLMSQEPFKAKSESESGSGSSSSPPEIKGESSNSLTPMDPAIIPASIPNNDFFTSPGLYYESIAQGNTSQEGHEYVSEAYTTPESNIFVPSPDGYPSVDQFAYQQPELDQNDPASLTEISRLYSRPKRPMVPADQYESDNSNETDPNNQLMIIKDDIVDLSPNSWPERIAFSVNHQYISDNLMRIYHDSMENALSCWLNERTCPYKHTYALDSNENSLALVEAWKPDWPNRIFQRVCSLDQKSGRFRDRPLTQEESTAASKALYLVIMAFASQWAQQSRRSREQHYHTSHPNGASNPGATGDQGQPEFDRFLQEQYWHEARRALTSCADIESFKVAFANIIFSLVQRPISEEQQEHLRNVTPSSSLDDDVSRILAADGPPIHLEQGVRHAHSLRHKLHRREREKAAQNPGVDPARTILSTADRTTVDMMAWLGYMLESLTSALHQRPLVVSDEDCDVLPDSFAAISLSDDLANEPRDASSRLWSDYFFLQEKHNRQNEKPLRYPCSYNEAAAGLTDAAPIKVLLYRKIIALQTLMARHASSSKIEATISESLEVYKHWGKIYEPFIFDCIAHHGQLHARIQSWYICLTAHWHLAALTFVNTLELIDSTARDTRPLCSRSNAAARGRARLVARLKQHNAYMVSELARVSTPALDGSTMLPTMHFAVNPGALLTEPWTDLLIRVFAAAALHLVSDAALRGAHKAESAAEDEQEVARATRSARAADECVRALKYLGKKSDSARLVGDRLGEAVALRWEAIRGKKRRVAGGAAQMPELNFGMSGFDGFNVGGLDLGLGGGDGLDLDWTAILEDDLSGFKQRL